MSTMDMIMDDMIRYWFIWVFAVFLFGFAAFAYGACNQWKKGSTAKCLIPMFCAELIILAIVAINAKEWIRIGASFHWVIYEHAPMVYLSVIAFVCILVGYLSGMTYARKKI